MRPTQETAGDHCSIARRQAHLSAIFLELWSRRQLALLEIGFPFGSSLLLLSLACLPCLSFFLAQVQLKAVYVQGSLCHDTQQALAAEGHITPQNAVETSAVLTCIS